MNQNKGCFEVWYLNHWLFTNNYCTLGWWEHKFLMTFAVPTNKSAGIHSEEMRKRLTSF